MTDLMIRPAVPMGVAIERYNELVDFVKVLLKQDLDYGVIPGTNKPTLYKPGAEKLCTFFGLTPHFEEIQVVEDWTGETHKGEPFFYYKTRCRLLQGERLVSECIASTNSWEERYRWRNQGKVCPKCGKPTIIKGKVEYGGGWICFAKKGGCGYKFADNDTTITSQVEGKVANDRIFDQVNTLQKQAQKRAFVGATLIGVNASEFFTQDVEDMAVIDGHYRDLPPEQNGSQPPEAEPAQVAQTAPKELATFERDGLTYRDNLSVEEVLVGQKWYPAKAAIEINDKTLEAAEALFTNEFERKNHLKKHFGVMNIRSLSWEQYAAMWMWKKRGIPSPKWYADKAGEVPAKVETEETPPPQDQLAAAYGLDSGLPPDDVTNFLANLRKLPDPLLLKHDLIDKGGLDIHRDWNSISSIAQILADSTVPVEPSDYDEMVAFAVEQKEPA